MVAAESPSSKGGEFTAVPPAGPRNPQPFTQAPSPGPVGPSPLAAQPPVKPGPGLADVPPAIPWNPRPLTGAAPPALPNRPPPTAIAPPTDARPNTPLAAPPPNAPRPPVAARPSPRRGPPPAEAAPEGMPPDVLAYVKWLKDVDANRITLDRAGQREVAKYLPMLMTTATMPLEADDYRRTMNLLAQAFNSWQARLMQLAGGFKRLDGLADYWAREGASGRPHVPQVCRALHVTYLGSLEAQAVGSHEAAAAIANRELGRAIDQMAASDRSTELYQRADGELRAVCDRYRYIPGYDIRALPGQTVLPPVTSR
jgi:hypothetical protein